MFIKLYAVALPIFLISDAIWLGVIAKSFYKNRIGFIMTSNINWGAAIVFYLIFIAGLVFFVISPAIEKKSSLYALIAGSLFGFITYATYDLTNLATIKGWPISVTIIDMIWGAALGAFVSFITVILVSKIGAL